MASMISQSLIHAPTIAAAQPIIATVIHSERRERASSLYLSEEGKGLPGNPKECGHLA